MRRSLRRELTAWAPPLIWMALIFIGSSIPGHTSDTLTRQASGIDEPVRIQRIKDAVHIVEFGVLAILLVRAFKKDAALTLRHALMSLGVAVLYGLADEIHQMFVPYRYPDLLDVARNTIGAALGVLIMLAAAGRRGKTPA